VNDFRSWFDELVERGRPIEERQRQAVEAAARRTQAVAHEIGKLCRDTVEYESKAALRRFGLMTRDDVRILSARLDTLSQKIDELAART
jgi:polyhydroxyalkanoate synthesis regulator phasin